MKQVLLTSLILCIGFNIKAQAPVGPGGKTLYKKSCERVATDFIECVYCEDEKLTQNCKKYWCQNNGSCTEAPLNNNGSTGIKRNLVDMSLFIEKSRKRKGRVLVYNERGEIKIFATFKKSAVVKLVAVNGNGERLPVEYSQIALKSCEVCITENGIKTCYPINCDDVPKPLPPLKPWPKDKIIL